MTTKLCQSCLMRPGTEKITRNRQTHYRCKLCLERKAMSFISRYKFANEKPR